MTRVLHVRVSDLRVSRESIYKGVRSGIRLDTIWLSKLFLFFNGAER